MSSSIFVIAEVANIVVVCGVVAKEFVVVV